MRGKKEWEREKERSNRFNVSGRRRRRRLIKIRRRGGWEGGGAWRWRGGRRGEEGEGEEKFEEKEKEEILRKRRRRGRRRLREKKKKGRRKGRSREGGLLWCLSLNYVFPLQLFSSFSVTFYFLHLSLFCHSRCLSLIFCSLSLFLSTLSQDKSGMSTLSIVT